MWNINNRIIIKDSTMREGMDVPGIALDTAQKRELLRGLIEVGIPEAEIVAPGHFERDLKCAKEIGAAGSPIRLSGLIYGNHPDWPGQIANAKGVLDRVDILIPLSDLRPPADRREKSSLMRTALRVATDSFEAAGAGFPHATQVEIEFLIDMCLEAVQAGARRITLYDTNGSADPWEVTAMMDKVRTAISVELCFHAHNDLGLATANSVAAVRAGADCLDVTVNGLGDRAGNASLEQVALLLHQRGATLSLHLDLLRPLSQAVAAMTLVPVPKLAPIVGEFVFCHKSPGHFLSPELFEAFDPSIVGGRRTFDKS